MEFTHEIKNGHISVYKAKSEVFVPAFKWEWIEDKLVITRVKDESSRLKIGDVVTKVNNQLSENYFKEVNSRISAGTTGWLNYSAQNLSL